MVLSRSRCAVSGARSAWRCNCAKTCSACHAVTGKPAGDDLREGKRTVLIAFTRERLDASSRRLLDELLGDPTLTADQVSSLQATIAESGALARVEELITSYAQEADRALSGARLDNAAVGELRDLARAATVRSA
jgi:geranylgeranyl diphosphate synthase type I